MEACGHMVHIILTVCHELLSSSPLVPYQKLGNENSAIALSNKKALISLDEPSPHTHEQSHVTHSHNVWSLFRLEGL